MGKVLKEYKLRIEERKESNGTLIPAIYAESYDFQWGDVKCKGLSVLDVGADIGSTAQFFLKKGAKQIIAVEGSGKCFNKLKSNAKSLIRVIPILLLVNDPKQIESLILKYKPDIVKMDIEGGEEYLFQTEDVVFAEVPEYIIEVHSNNLFDMLKKKSEVNNYEIVRVSPPFPSGDTPPYIVHITKKLKVQVHTK